MDDKILLAHLKSMKRASADLSEMFREAKPELGSAMEFSLLYIEYSLERLEDLVRGTDSSDGLMESFFREMESSSAE